MATDVHLSTSDQNLVSIINDSLMNKTHALLNSSVTQNVSTSSYIFSDIVTQNGTSLDVDVKEANKGWFATLFLLLATLLANGTVLGLTWRTSRLHSTLYVLLASLALVHALNALLVMPMTMYAVLSSESDVSWSLCVAWTSLTYFLMASFLLHMGFTIIHSVVLLLTPLWYRQCNGITYPSFLVAASWILPLLLIIPGSSLLNTSERTLCTQPLSIETTMALHVPTCYVPVVMIVVIYSIATYIIQHRCRVTSQLQSEGLENAANSNRIERGRFSSIISDNSSMVTYHSETPSICSDNGSVHSIPSIDDDGSAVAISLPNGRNGYVHLNQAPPASILSAGVQNGHVTNGLATNGVDTHKKVVANGSAVCLPDTILPAGNEEEKKQRPKDVPHQISSESDSMQLEIHKVDTDSDTNSFLTNTSTTSSVIDSDIHMEGAASDATRTELQEDHTASECIEPYNDKLICRKLSDISERNDSGSVRSDESGSVRGTPTHRNTSNDSTVPTQKMQTNLGVTSTNPCPSPTNQSKNAHDNKPSVNIPSHDNLSLNESPAINGKSVEDLESTKASPNHTDNQNTPINSDVRTKCGKEQLNEPLEDCDIEISVEDKLVDSTQGTSDQKGRDNFGFVLNDTEELSLSDSIKVNHNVNKDTTQAKDEVVQESPSLDGTPSGGHSRSSSQDRGGISGPRRSILRRDKSKRQSGKSVKFAIPDSGDDDKPRQKRIVRKPTGKVPRNQNVRNRKTATAKAAPRRNDSASKRRKTLVKQKAQSEEDTPPAPNPDKNTVISSVAPYAPRPPLISGSSSFSYMAAVQNSQAERLNCRIKVQQININTLFLVYLTYLGLAAPYIILEVVLSQCSSCSTSRDLRMGLRWLMHSASFMVPVLLLCFLTEYRIALKRPPVK